MKIFKNGCIACLFICTQLFMFSLQIPRNAKIIIFFAELLVVLIYQIVLEVLKCIVDWQFGLFITIVLKNLPEKDFENLVLNDGFLRKYDHTLKSMCCVIDEIAEYGEKYFSEEGKNAILESMPIYEAKLEDLDSIVDSKPMRLVNALHMPFRQIFRQYCMHGIKSSLQKNISKQNKKEAKFLVVYYIPCISVAIFWIWTNAVSFMLMVCGLVAICITHILCKKHVSGSIGLVATNWFLVFLVVMLSPAKISKYEFQTLGWGLLYAISLLAIIIIGLWITNELWTRTDIERANKGSFVANHRLMFVLDTKIMSKARYIWLWITFFGIIICTIFAYAIIFYVQLSLGTPMHCTLLAISMYFGNSNTAFDTIEGIYFSSETVSAFVINTLYLGNIVRLIFEPRLRK